MYQINIVFMLRLICALGALTLFSGCSSAKQKSSKVKFDKELVIAFGSCDNQKIENLLWDDVLKNNPDVWIWGGDNIYSDPYNKYKMIGDYDTQLRGDDYRELMKSTEIIGVWDDHDYGLNDGGVEFEHKKESEQLFYDFFNEPKNSALRKREGTYSSRTYTSNAGSVKIILLDTRYFRSPLTKDFGSSKRYMPNAYGDGTLLGAEQWKWLEQELISSKADFNVIVSSIQVLSNKHGYEMWGNFPHEVDKLFNLITTSRAKGVIFLSGDRHISEFSKININGLGYPVYDFTSSGLTHSYDKFNGEENPFREGKVIKQRSFGLLKLNLETRKVKMQMVGDGNILLQELDQVY
ncbi:alkaline phosphatase D [Zhouia amylolytica]|uniref:Alkaline phosphatase D n=2 Tax=Zhouia amylolytica TaxID=376730 RepID=A0A1I6QBN1_9FLAO|nr:alkaline phosphatase D [Zhouia amylolytica]